MPRPRCGDTLTFMRRMATVFFATVSLTATAWGQSAMSNESAGHVIGIGGVFVKSKDPKALAAWYRDVLGMPVQSWGGAMFRQERVFGGERAHDALAT